MDKVAKATRANKADRVARLVDELDPATFLYVLRTDAIDASIQLLDKGVSSSRMRALANKGIDIATHSRIVDTLFTRKGARAIKGADDAMETLANQRLRQITGSGKSVLEEVVIKTDSGRNIEIDSAIVNSDGKIISIGQMKLSTSPNAYYESVGQIGKNWQYITGARGKVTEISTASGSISPSKLDPDVIDEAYTYGPAGGNAKLPQEVPQEHTKYLPGTDELAIQNRRSFSYTLPDSKAQIESAYQTFKGARGT